MDEKTISFKGYEIRIRHDEVNDQFLVETTAIMEPSNQRSIFVPIRGAVEGHGLSWLKEKT